MQIVATSKERFLRPVSTSGGRVTQKYNIIKELFKKDKNYLIFSEPDEVSKEEIIWKTALEGEVKRYTSLSEKEQKYLRAKLKSQVKRLYREAKEENSKNYLNLFLQIPSLDDIYLIGDFVVLANWGYLEDRFNAPKNIIKKLLKGVILSILIVDDEKKPISNLNVELNYNGESEIYTTNSDGFIRLVDVVKNSIVKLRIDLKENSKYEEEFIEKEIEILDSDTEYQIVIKKRRVNRFFKKEAEVNFYIYDAESRKEIKNAKVTLISKFDTITKETNSRGRTSIKIIYKDRVEAIIKADGYYQKREEFEIYNLEKKEIYLKPIQKLEGKEGKIGDPRINISWINTPESGQDIDLHLITPCNQEIYFQNKKVICNGYKGELDVDRLHDCLGECQENITWQNGAVKGKYTIRVRKYNGDEQKTKIKLTLLNNGEVTEEIIYLKNLNDEYRKSFKH